MQKHCLCFAQAILGALFFVLAFPPVGWWWVLPLGLALLIDAMGTDEFSKRTIFALGVLVYGVLFCWVRYVTLWGWVALSVFSALLWLGAFVVWRRTRSPLISAGVWVLFEQIREALGWGWLPAAAAWVAGRNAG
jgi:apolipoprotein N-acyltransferase